ncbi:MAG TPA: hypothetical protein VI814_04225 [Candidatus Limnocylindria bacterium]
MAKKKRADREVARRRAESLATQQRLGRWRTVVGWLGFVPLAAAIGCGTGTPLDALLCGAPRELWLLVWAALFGTFIGLTIRLVIERRRFERGTTNGRAA